MDIKKKNTIVLFIVILGVAFMMFPITVNAAYPTYKHDWEWNYNGAAYYYNVNLSSNYVNAAKQAADNWYKTGYHTNPLYPMKRTYTQTDSPMDLYKETLGNNLLGLTTFFRAGGAEIRVDDKGPVQNWRYCKILIDEEYTNFYFGSNMKSSVRKVLLAHEMGHVFGLAHTTSKATIMYPYIDEITVTSITKADSAALVQKLNF